VVVVVAITIGEVVRKVVAKRTFNFQGPETRGATVIVIQAELVPHSIPHLLKTMTASPWSAQSVVGLEPPVSRARHLAKRADGVHSPKVLGDYESPSDFIWI
jgi:hypothetical protein